MIVAPETVFNYNSWDFGKAAATAFTGVAVDICEQLNPYQNIIFVLDGFGSAY